MRFMPCVIALSVLFGHLTLVRAADEAVDEAVDEFAAFNWKVVNTTADFSFMVPPDMAQIDGQGIDSYVQYYRNNGIYLLFDYGAWGVSATVADEYISGRPAVITEGPAQREIDGVVYNYYAALHFLEIGRGGDTLVMVAFVKEGADVELAKGIFRSIRFE